MMIQMMDRNGDGKLSKNEVGGMDLDSMLAQADMSAVKQYVPDIEKLIKKVTENLTPEWDLKPSILGQENHKEGRSWPRQSLWWPWIGKSYARYDRHDDQENLQINHFTVI